GPARWSHDRGSHGAHAESESAQSAAQVERAWNHVSPTGRRDAQAARGTVPQGFDALGVGDRLSARLCRSQLVLARVPALDWTRPARKGICARGSGGRKRMTDARARLAWVVAALCSVPIGASLRPACAQQMDPRAYANAPTGQNFVIAGYGHSQGGVL